MQRLVLDVPADYTYAGVYGCGFLYCPPRPDRITCKRCGHTHTRELAVDGSTQTWVWCDRAAHCPCAPAGCHTCCCAETVRSQ